MLKVKILPFDIQMLRDQTNLSTISDRCQQQRGGMAIATPAGQSIAGKLLKSLFSEPQ